MSNNVNNTKKKGSFWKKALPFILSLIVIPLVGGVISWIWMPFAIPTIVGSILCFVWGIMRLVGKKKK